MILLLLLIQPYSQQRAHYFYTCVVASHSLTTKLADFIRLLDQYASTRGLYPLFLSFSLFTKSWIVNTINNMKTVCSICLDQVGDSLIAFANCGHVFDRTW